LLIVGIVDLIIPDATMFDRAIAARKLGNDYVLVATAMVIVGAMVIMAGTRSFHYHISAGMRTIVGAVVVVVIAAVDHLGSIARRQSPYLITDVVTGN